LKAVESRVD